MKLTNKFNSFFIIRKRANESGKQDEDLIEDAMQNYFEKVGKKFPFKHCLEVLWTCQQFDVMIAEGERPPSRAERPPSRASLGGASSLASLESQDDNALLDGSDQDEAAGSVNQVAKTVQAVDFARPGGAKKAKMFLKSSRRKEYWHQQKDRCMVELTRATLQTADVLRFAATQNAISARVGHYIMLGQRKKAYDLLESTNDLLDINTLQDAPLEQHEPQGEDSAQEEGSEADGDDDKEEEKEDNGEDNNDEDDDGHKLLEVGGI